MLRLRRSITGCAEREMLRWRRIADFGTESGRSFLKLAVQMGLKCLSNENVLLHDIVGEQTKASSRLTAWFGCIAWLKRRGS